ncbi:hypothetical protein [Christiangramia crocea]|uniref:Histidine Kinase domain-containing protein n=1 Tax=Christiangramia crocea TaxID=2904124 RepID=A0A9X1UVR5_9FLAO|nr:hypothetical protein [Gramella crocea]MCG9971153.1 hypothetical protein [Gramella crocea]
MKKAETLFITNLLSNPKLTSEQKSKVFELAMRDIGKNGSDKLILQELQLIKKKMGIGTSKTYVENDSKNFEGTNPSGFTGLPEFDENTVKIITKSNGNEEQENNSIKSSESQMRNSTEEKIISDERVKEILEKMKNRKNESKKNSLSYYSPVSLYKYLYDYNQDPILRSTCHEIDSNELVTINDYCGTETYQFPKHLEAILKAFERHEKNHFAPSRVKALIRGYLTGKDYYKVDLGDGWSGDNIKFSWSSKELKKWCKMNENFPPCPDPGLIESHEIIGFEFSEAIKSKNFNKYLKTFNDLVIHFKHLFHIRQDNSLKQILLLQNKIKNWNEKIDFEIENQEFPTNIELFTDVDKLIQAYNIIIDLILKRQIEEMPRVKLSFYQTSGGVELSIHHLNTSYHKSLIDTIERPLGKTYKALIDNQLNGMCNFYVRADFDQKQFAKVNIWNGKPRTAEPLDFFEGVEHIFEFRKK